MKNIYIYINDVPKLPTYITKDYKSFDQYDDRYKNVVNSYFELLKHSLCSDNETQINILKTGFVIRL